MNIGQRIREVREDLGMQAAVLARRVGVAPNTIYRIEAGDRTPSVALLEKIARELRTEPADLFKAPEGAGQPRAQAAAEPDLTLEGAFEDFEANLTAEQVREILEGVLSGRISVEGARQLVLASRTRE